MERGRAREKKREVVNIEMKRYQLRETKEQEVTAREGECIDANVAFTRPEPERMRR